MILSNKHRFIYTAFNKTGSSSVEDALDDYRGRITSFILKKKYKGMFPEEKVVFKHISPVIVRELVGHEKWTEYTTFAFVRNPWDRIVSLYHYHKQKIPGIYPEAQAEFEQWVKAGGSGTAQRLMSEFVSDKDGNVIVDRIGRFENLEEDFRVICKELGIACNLPHYNKTERKSYRDYYNDETRKIVSSWVQKDAEMFDYEF